ncbi:MAG: competence/damage-inducible protein A [Microcoleus sp. SIO2G3]|nr:competence/damage-inducible protein A [Microcoleus sp. SIO2G3]
MPARSAEIICVGTELLLGEILNSNAQFLAQQLAELGIPHFFQTVVGDNPARLQQAIATACDRATLLIFTGGLGPTPDDLTTETIAVFFQVPLTERSEVIKDIDRKYAQRGREMTASNRKQALLPQGADVLPNPSGTAPGLIWQPRPNITLLTFPGVPSEMRRMWRETAAPFLQRQGWGQTVILSRTLRFWGVSESVLAEKVKEFFNLINPTVAPYAAQGEVRLRVTAKAASAAAAAAAIDPVARQLRQIAGADYFGTDDDTLASVVGTLLQQRQETVSVAESCTGGGLGEALTSIAGSSRYFWGGVISYSNEVKQQLLGVDPDALVQYGAVSDEVAQQMASGVRDRLNTTWGIGITGVAGPDGGTATKPVGLVYIGLAGRDRVTSLRCQFSSHHDRSLIRRLSVCTALDLLRRQLLPTEQFL